MQQEQNNLTQTGALLNATGSVGITVQNPAANNQAIVYVNTAAVLLVTLTNSTGSVITLPTGSYLEVYMPSYFTAAEIQQMKVTGISLTGLTGSYNVADTTLQLTMTSTQSGTWNAGATLSFSITNAVSTASPGSDSVQVNFNNLIGQGVPSEVMCVVALENAPIHTNVDLDTVLQVEPEYGGVVYASTSVDPITNTVYLNLKNTGANPLYNGSKMWSGNPHVLVSFAYGTTSGALAPADKSSSGNQGSAWAISGSVAVDQTAGWTVQNPSPSGAYNAPVWILRPVNSNQQIIGTGNSANVTFAFSNIFSFTPPGATQMYVQFVGFTQNENTSYNDAVFTVPLFKQTPPVYRGILNMYGPAIVYVMQAQTIAVPVKWTGYQIDSVKLICNVVPEPTPFTNSYVNDPTLVYDGTTVSIDSMSPGDLVTFTLESFDGYGNLLNEPQFTVTVEQQAAVYTFSSPPVITYFTIGQTAVVSLNWKIYNVASIAITGPNCQPFTKQYTAQLWTEDSGSFTVNNLGTGLSTIPFTLTAYDQNGNVLNSMQCSAQVEAQTFIDPKDQKSYAVVVINGTTWMAQNYDGADPNAFFLNNDPSTEEDYGLYYTFASATSNAPTGCRLPTNVDWNNLFNYFGSQAAYSALMQGGSSGFEAGSGAYLSVIENTWLTFDGLYWGFSNQMSYAAMFENNYAGVASAYTFYARILACNVRYIVNPAGTQTESEMSQIHMDADSASGSVALTVVNADANHLPQIYVNTPASLSVSIINNTGGAIFLQQNSSLEVYMPSYFSTQEVAAMRIDSMSMNGWAFSLSADGGLLLVYSNSTGELADGSVFSFTITNVVSAAQPASDTVQVNFNNMTGQNVPLEVTTPLGLLLPVASGNVDLTTVLQVALNDDTVYVSVAADPIANTLELNFKNAGNTPLYTGTKLWTGNPRVTVSFAYGNTSGALAPQAKSASPVLGSAWNISAEIYSDQTGGWTVANPSPSGDTNSPVWILAPESTNQQIIGTNTSANVTFAFSNIFSLTPAGSTQMYVQFSGFPQDENTMYNDMVFVLDIDKQNDPPRGLTKLEAPPSYVDTTAFNTATSAQVSVGWYGANIGKVVLQCTNSDGEQLTPFSKTYPNNSSPEFDSATVIINNVRVGDVLSFNLYAYENDGVTEINSLPFAVTVEQQPDAYVFSCDAQVYYAVAEPIAVTLNWQVFDAASIQITADVDAGTFTKKYDATSGLITDSGTVTIAAPTVGLSVTFTLNAYGASGALLNSQTCSTVLNPSTWNDPNDNNKSYAVVVLNKQVWLAQDYDHNDDASGGSTLFKNDPSLEAVYGRMYHPAVAVANTPSGWRLPTPDDWNGLISLYANTPTDLFAGGSSGLNLQFGGTWDSNNNTFIALTAFGSCWASTNGDDPGVYNVVAFDFDTIVVTTTPDNGNDPASVYVRYVLNS